MKYYNNIVETIGNTPLVKLNRITANLPGLYLAKVEYFNPGNSIKDRIGIKMILDAEAEGRLKPGGTVIECTSGNTGMGLALASVVRGYKCIFTTTDKQSKQKLDILRALGAEVIVCPTNVEPDDPRSYYSVAKRLAKEIPNSVHMNQYDNLSNRAAHYETTGPEIWEQTEGRVTHYVTTIGTGGTIMGVAMYLKEKNPNIQVLGVDVYGSLLKKYHDTGQIDMNEVYPYVTEGIGEDFVPANYDMKYIDHIEQVTDKDGAIMARRLAREEGLFCGYSAGSLMQGLQQMKDRFDKNSIVVCILHDHGSRYVAKIYNDEWMRERGFLIDEPVTARSILESKRMRELVSVSPKETVAASFRKMKEKSLTQLPVMDGNEMVGSISERDILHLLMDNPAHRDDEVGKVMAKPFPIVDLNATAAEISKYINAQNSAVMVKTQSGEWGIITEYDLIDAMAG
ncbi:MAG: pyridoxal-phosphate dependent enzyme [Chitinophagales bacterium]|nr:pyridoxal-phosphate dependent enzyme [Chitinophagales bacterium]MDW8419811.1 pyridoxal-phosphate dependent enzyme [Chitinophagales bacterium]